MTLVTKERGVSNKKQSTLSTAGFYRPGTATVNKTSTESTYTHFGHRGTSLAKRYS